MKKLIDWIDYRLPIFTFFSQFITYRVPKNLNYLWTLGAIATVGLVIQIVTGIILSMHYVPHIDHAFNSVDRIMRYVNYGWLIRYMHSVGASMFFLSVYLHMLRGLMYGSYKYPRELLWQIGVVIFLVMVMTAFTGYILPWGQMSYWAATVITNIFSAIPIIGNSIVVWICGGYSISSITLNRFFSIHYLLPFIILALLILHIAALKVHGSNNPKGVDLKSKDHIPFHPYYTIKDLFGLVVYGLIFVFFVFYSPNYLNHPDNYIPANPLVTPEHIVPEWYFLPFYAILRSIPNKLGGLIVMLGSILIWIFLPLLDKSHLKSIFDRPLYKPFFIILILSFISLGYLGTKVPTSEYIFMSQVATFYYFLHFMAIIPIVSYLESKEFSSKS